jgi:hypothetical protein
VEAAALVGRACGRRGEEARDPGLAEGPVEPLPLGRRAEVEDYAPRAADGVGYGREAVDGAVEVTEVGGVPERDDEDAVG